MYKLKKGISVVLAGVLISTSVLVTGCTSQKGKNSNNSDATQAQTTASQKVNLSWYIRNSSPKNLDSVVNKANELIEKKINANVQLNFFEPGDYNNKMQILLSSSENFDLCFSSWFANYESNTLKGGYLALDSMIDKFPKIKELFSKDIWDGTKVNGKIFGVPNLQIMYDQPGLWLKKDLVDKYKIDVASIKKLEDLTPIFQKIKDGEPDIIPIVSGIASNFVGYYSSAPGGLVIDTKTWKVFDPTETVYYEALKVMRDWNKKGFFPADVATLKDTDPLIKSGKVFARYQRQTPSAAIDFKAKYGYDVVLLTTGPKSINRNAITSTMTSISNTSKNPEKAMALIELMLTDKDIYNTLAFGIEGQDYKRTSGDNIEQIKGNYSVPGWMLGNTFNTLLVSGMTADIIEQTKKLNTQADVDPTVSLCFDTTSLTTELAQMAAVNNEFNTPLGNGIDDTDKLIKARSDKMKAAGRDKVIAELQKQLDAWRASKK